MRQAVLEGGSTLTYNDLGVSESIIRTYWNEGDLTWTLTADGTMTISGKGAMKDYSWSASSPATQKKASVKKVVIQEGVTSIGKYAFKDCSNLASIEIPKGVTSIGGCAFQDCSNLASIEIPKETLNKSTVEKANR